MSQHRKKILGIMLITLLVIGGILFFIYRPLPVYDTTTTTPEEEDIDTVIDQVEQKDEEVTSTANDVTQNLRDALEQTLSVFTRTDYRMTALGDSLTQGVGDETNHAGYVGVLENRFERENVRVQIDNFGKRGHRTDQLLTRINEEADMQRSIERADSILITIGANDIMRIVRENVFNLNLSVFDSEHASFEARLTDLFDTITALNPEAEVYLLGFFNPFAGYFDEVEALDDILTTWSETSRQVIETYPNGHYIPIDDLFQLNRIELLADDNFHPNATGYHLIGARVYHYLAPEIEALSAEEPTENEAE